MAIEKTIDINVNAKEAINDITLLNSILEEQEQITIELLQEQQKLEQQLKDTPKNALAAQKQLNTQLNHVKDSIKDQNLSVKKLKVQQKSLSKGTNDLTNDLVSNGGAMGILNNLTGGLAQQFKDSYEAISLSSKGLSGFKKAMVATGIGAFVIALGYVISNFDKIKDLVSGVTKEQKKSLEVAEQNVILSSRLLENTNESVNSLKLQGKTEKEIRDIKIQQTNESILAFEAQLLSQKQIKKSQIETAKRNKDILQGIIRFVFAPISLILKMVDGITYAASLLPGVGDIASNLESRFSGGIAGLVFDSKEVAVKADDTIRETEKQLRNLRNKRDGYLLAEKETSKKNGEDKVTQQKEEDEKLASLKDKIREAEANKEDEARALELLKIKEHNEKLLQEAKDADLLTEELKDSLNEKLTAKQAEFDAIDKERRDKKKAEEDAKNKKASEERIKEAKEKIELDNKVKDAKVEIAQNTLSLISEVAGEGSKIGKGVALAQATISGIEGVQNAYTTAQKSPITAVFPAYPIIQAGLAGAFSAMQLKKIASTNPSKGSASGGGASVGGGATAPQPPAFNIVGASDSNQLAEAIGGQSQQPIQTYVVSNDVTTAQSLQNNIVEGATIG